MRISDWSSDVCSSDLALTYVPNGAAADNSEPGEGEGSTGQACFSEMLLHVSVLLRGQGRTEGLHDRVIAVRPSMRAGRSEEHTSELQSLMRISYAVFCLKKKKRTHINMITRKKK